MVFQCRIQDFLYLTVQAVDLIDKQHVIRLQIGQDRRQITGFFNCRTGCHTKIHAHFVGNDRGQGRLSQSRRPVQQHVIQRIATPLGCLDIDCQIFLDFILSDIFHQRLRTECHFCFAVFFHFAGCHHTLLKLHITGFNHFG